MFVRPVRPRDVVADAISRAVTGPAWSGTIPELHRAIEAAATAGERQAPDWPRSAVMLMACLRAQTDALRVHGLRMSTMPGALLIERVTPTARHEPPMPGRAAA